MRKLTDLEAISQQCEAPQSVCPSLSRKEFENCWIDYFKIH